VAMRRRVEADRATPRTTVRYVTGITLLAVAALVTLDRTYMAPFSSPVGQVSLAVACALFAGAFWLMHRLVTDPPPHRFLSAAPSGRP
jgi:tight adherence protein B